MLPKAPYPTLPYTPPTLSTLGGEGRVSRVALETGP